MFKGDKAEKGMGGLQLSPTSRKFESQSNVDRKDRTPRTPAFPDAHFDSGDDDANEDDFERNSSLLQQQQPPPYSPRFRRSLGSSVSWLSSEKIPFLNVLFHPLIPSFLLPRARSRRLHPTSYLDGLRGIAAITVVFSHYVIQFYPHLRFAWHANHDPPEMSSIWQFPIIRLVHAGHISVHIFFVISGYVLSHKPLGLSRQKRWNTFARSLSSSVLRRWARLMLPAIASALLGFFLVVTGMGRVLSPDWAGQELPYMFSGEGRVGIALPKRLDSFWAQLADFIKDTIPTLDPLQLGTAPWPQYNAVLWTLALEMMGSWIVFVVVLCMAFLKQPYRILVPVFLGFWAWYRVLWHWSAFLIGIVLSEVSYIREDYKSTIEHLSTRPGAHLLHKMSFSVIFILCLYTASYPNVLVKPEDSSHWSFLYKFAKLFPGPGQFTDLFWLSTSAYTLVFILDNAKFLQTVFTTSCVQYLGDISLSLYMLHDILLLSVGNRLMAGFAAMLGYNVMSMMFGTLVLLGITIWASDVFWRCVDLKSIGVSQWIARNCMVEEESGRDRLLA